jgi:hypothetical protein
VGGFQSTSQHIWPDAAYDVGVDRFRAFVRHTHAVCVGEYLPAIQRPGPHYARVGVALEIRDHSSVSLSPTAYDWLQNSYPDAAIASPWHKKLGQQASAGSRYALAVARISAQVTIELIYYSNADTSPADVAYAAAFVVWTALNVEPDDPPWIDQDGLRLPDEPARDPGGCPRGRRHDRGGYSACGLDRS